MLTVNVLVNILDALDAAGGLDIEMTPVLAEEVRVVGNDPTTIDVFIAALAAANACGKDIVSAPRCWYSPP